MSTEQAQVCDHTINCPWHGDGDCDENTETGLIAPKGWDVVDTSVED